MTMKCFRDWSETSDENDLHESLRSMSIGAAGAVIIAQANRIRMHLSRVDSVNASMEDKIEAIAAALDAFNTKTTAMAALIYASSRGQ